MYPSRLNPAIIKTRARSLSSRRTDCSALLALDCFLPKTYQTYKTGHVSRFCDSLPPAKHTPVENILSINTSWSQSGQCSRVVGSAKQGVYLGPLERTHQHIQTRSSQQHHNMDSIRTTNPPDVWAAASRTDQLPSHASTNSRFQEDAASLSTSSTYTKEVEKQAVPTATPSGLARLNPINWSRKMRVFALIGLFFALLGIASGWFTPSVFTRPKYRVLTLMISHRRPPWSGPLAPARCAQ